MVKESIKRGYMTKEEVKGHLKGIPTTKAKIAYLNDVLKKKGLLKKKTRDNVYENLAEIYERKGDMYKAQDFYEKAGDEKKVKIIQRDFIRKRIEKHRKDFIRFKKEVRERIFNRVGEEGIKAFLPRKPYISTSRTQLFGSMIKSLEDLRRSYENIGEDKRAKKIQRKIEIEKERFVNRFFDSYIKEKETNKEEDWGYIGPIGHYRGEKEKTVKLLDYYGIKFDEKRLKTIYDRKKTDLVSKLSLIIGIAGAIFFLSPNITGNAIANLSSTSSNWIGVVLFILGIAGAFFCIKK